MKCNPNGPCRVGSSIYQISYGLRHLIQQTPTWISLIIVFSYITSGTNQQSQLSKTLLNYEAPFQISDRIILYSHDIRRKNTWNNVVLIVQQFVSRFLICLTKNLIEHINFSSDRPVHRSQQNHRGAQISLLFLEGTDKLRLICLFYYLLNCTQRHVL